jgi:SLIT-ROBO Rho GTPase activating protein
MMNEGIVKINSKMLDFADLKRLDKQEKENISWTGAVVKDIRVQLNDQLKNLDGRLEIQQGIVSEFHDVFRRRAEIEANYSKELDKLAKLITNRNKEHKQRRDGWQTFSSVQLWEQLVNHTKKSSRDHAALSDIYTCHIVQRCNQINEDLQRIYKKVL